MLKGARVEVAEVISAEQRCFIVLTFLSADSENMKNISADLLCFSSVEKMGVVTYYPILIYFSKIKSSVHHIECSNLEVFLQMLIELVHISKIAKTINFQFFIGKMILKRSIFFVIFELTWRHVHVYAAMEATVCLP